MTDKKVIKTEPRYTAPCAPGDTVYVVNCDYSGAYVRNRTITRVAFETDNNPQDSFTKGAIGKNVFLDREEAETTAASDAAKKLVEQAKADHEAYQDYIVCAAKDQSEADKLEAKEKTCRDCIHHDVCTLADDARFKDDIRKHCENYKDKALCIWPQEDEDPYVFMSYEAAETELERRRERSKNEL